jgi:hypothetical protein
LDQGGSVCADGPVAEHLVRRRFTSLLRLTGYDPMPRDRATDDAVVEVNFAARTLRDRTPSASPPSRDPASLMDVLYLLLDRRASIAAMVLVVLALGAA